MARKPGGNPVTIKEALERGAEILRNGVEGAEGRKPIAAEAADRVVEQLTARGCQSPLERIKDQLGSSTIAQNGLLAGGAVAAADGVRRMVQKDDDGKRHVVRGAVQTAAGVGAFTAALLAKRAGNEPQQGGHSR